MLARSQLDRARREIFPRALSTGTSRALRRNSPDFPSRLIADADYTSATVVQVSALPAPSHIFSQNIPLRVDRARNNSSSTIFRENSRKRPRFFGPLPPLFSTLNIFVCTVRISRSLYAMRCSIRVGSAMGGGGWKPHNKKSLKGGYFCPTPRGASRFRSETRPDSSFPSVHSINLSSAGHDTIPRIRVLENA